MEKKIKLATFTMMLGVLCTSVGVAVSSGLSPFSITALECDHQGNHYTALNATTRASGIHEYWVCCKCHEHFLLKPSSGKWTDAGKANITIDSTDDRYIPKTSEYDEKGFKYSADGTKITGFDPKVGGIDIVIPEGVTDIGTTFSDTDIISITIPSSVTTIDGGAFQNCDKLKNVTISEGVKEIQSESSLFAIHGAFQYCTSLEWIVIPESVKQMDALEFGSCSSSLKIYCVATSKPSGWDSSWNNRTVFGNKFTTYWGGQWHYDANGVPVANK